MWWTVLLKVKWYAWVIGALGLSNVFTYTMWQNTSHTLKIEKASHIQDITNFKTAQAIANATAQATRDALIRESKLNASKADADYSTLYAKYHANLLYYTRPRSSGQTNHNQLSATEGSNGPGTSPQLPQTITITGADADICAVNTARLQAVHDWAISLPSQP